MGLLDRLKNLDVEALNAEALVATPAVTTAKVNAILGVLAVYLDPDSGISNALFAIARKELSSADDERLDVVISGVIDAADKLRPLLSGAPAPSPPASLLGPEAEEAARQMQRAVNGAE